MQELTEREKKLIDIIKKLINTITITGIYFNQVSDLTKWRNESFETIGFNQGWQDEILHMLEGEFGIIYKKVKDNGEPFEEEDGNKD